MLKLKTTTKNSKPFYLFFILFLLPSYLMRFSILGIPTTLLEILIWIGFGWSLFDWRQWSKIKTIPRAMRFTIVLFLLGAMTGIIRAPDKIAALGQFKGFILDPLLFSGLIYIWTLKSKDAKNTINRLYDGLILSGIILGLIALWQKLNGITTFDGRVMSVWQWDPGASPNYLSLYLVPVAVWLFCINPNLNLPARQAGKFRSKISKIFETIFHTTMLYSIVVRALTFAILILGITFSGSRAGLLAVGGGILFWLIAANSRKITISRPLVYTSLAIAFLAVFWWTGKPDFSASPDSGRVSSSNNIRWEIWRVTIREILPQNQNWLGGVGLGNFQNYFTELTSGRVNFPEYIAPRALTPHNLYLHLWTSGGIIMLVGFLWLVWQIFRNPGGIAEKSAIFSILIYGLIDTPVFKNDLGVMWWGMIAILLIKKPTEQAPRYSLFRRR